MSLNFRVWAAMFADRTIKGDYLSWCGTKLFPRPPRTHWKGYHAHISQTRLLVTISHQPAPLRKSTSSSASSKSSNQRSSKWGCKKCIMQRWSLPSGGLQSKTRIPGSDKHRDVINTDKDEKCISCKPHCQQTEQFVVITDLSWIQISDPKAPLSGCYFQSP